MARWCLVRLAPPLPAAPSDSTAPSAPAVPSPFSNSQERPATSPDFVSKLGMMGRAAKGRPVSLSHKEANSRAQLKAWSGERGSERKEELSKRLKGVPKTTEHKKKMSDVAKLRPEAHILKIKAIHKNKPVNPNHPRGHCNCPCGCEATTSFQWYGAKRGVRQQCKACYNKARRNATGCTCVNP
jgi:hypothetical protein